MMKMSEMFPKNFLAKEDITHPVSVTIRQVTQEEVAGDGGKELKAVIHFNGNNLKPMILNRGNADTLCAAYGDDSVAWHGRAVEIYVDPSVMFAGKRVGGLRLRIPAVGAAPSANGTTDAAVGYWDVSDGKSVLAGQTTEQVRELIAGSTQPPASFRVKPAGAPREAAKPAPDWPQFAPAVVAAGGEEIPF